MGLRGDFAQLGALRQTFQQASDKARETLTKAAGAEALTQVQLGFRGSHDPYGEPWKALASRNGMPLLDTGRLRNSFSWRATPAGFTVGTNVAYAKYHQYGTNGRKRAQTRMQAVGKGGRFMSRAKAGKAKRGFTSVRALNFKAGTGKIPARPMLPTHGLGPVWGAAIKKAMTLAFRRLLKR